MLWHSNVDLGRKKSFDMIYLHFCQAFKNLTFLSGRLWGDCILDKNLHLFKTLIFKLKI